MTAFPGIPPVPPSLMPSLIPTEARDPVRPLLWFPNWHMPGANICWTPLWVRVQTGSLGISFTSLKGCVIVITVAPILWKGKLRLRGTKICLGRLGGWDNLMGAAALFSYHRPSGIHPRLNQPTLPPTTQCSYPIPVWLPPGYASCLGL